MHAPATVDDVKWTSRPPPLKEYKVPELPVVNRDDEAEQLLRMWRGGGDRLNPEEARRVNGGRAVAGGAKRIVVSDKARARAVEILKKKERELIDMMGSTTFRGYLSSTKRPIYRERNNALELRVSSRPHAPHSTTLIPCVACFEGACLNTEVCDAPFVAQLREVEIAIQYFQHTRQKEMTADQINMERRRNSLANPMAA